MSEGSATPPPRRRLQRLRAALAEHNWLSVAIEIVIVTVGVLLAFEIEQWGERRERAEEERRFLERLYVENRGAIAELEPLVRLHEKAHREIGAALRNRHRPDLLARFARSEDGFGCGTATLPAAPFNDTASQELVASGKINLISDPALRALVREVAASQAQGALRLSYGRQLIGTIYPPIMRYYRSSLEGDKVRCRIQWDALVQDQTAFIAALASYQSHGLLREEREKTLDAERQLNRVLACKLGKLECRR